MKVTMRLYRMHDLDLLYLYKMPNVSIQKIIKIVLKNYVVDRTQGCRIVNRVKIPRIDHDKKLPNSALIHIYLKEGEDDEVIEWLQQTARGTRNSMLKNILRSYIDFPVTVPYELEVKNIAVSQNQNTIQALNSSLAKAKSRNDKDKTQPAEPEQPTEEMVNDILEAPLDSPPPPAKPKKSNKVVKPIQNTAVTLPNVTQDNNENDEDIFGDFEAMMGNF